MERRCLQAAVALTAVILLFVGLSGVMLGVRFLHGIESASIDNYFRFLSATAAGMGIMYLCAIPHIERHSERIGTLTFLIFAGGLAHLYGFILRPAPTVATLCALAMALIVVPLLWLWQRRIAHKASH
ncbi:MAG: DUF4345 domain-containing protein [Bradyrhizobiaceae bacterium]|nr:MAG: DUF4345 domain-containing protein [Bradyrhizobiaceae bacterium]